jgi:hypothetical protein
MSGGNTRQHINHERTDCEEGVEIIINLEQSTCFSTMRHYNIKLTYMEMTPTIS